MTKLEQLKKIIQEANPEKRWIKIAQEIPMRKVEKPIRLADVLLAIDKSEKRTHKHIFNEVKHIQDGIGDGDTFRVLDYIAWFGWNWKDDNLDNQSNECKKFLIDLLIKYWDKTKYDKGTVEFS